MGACGKTLSFSCIDEGLLVTDLVEHLCEYTRVLLLLGCSRTRTTAATISLITLNRCPTLGLR